MFSWGIPQFGWLQTLNASNRNWRRWPSLYGIWNTLCTSASSPMMPDDARADNGVAPDIAELSGRSFDKRVRIPVAGRCGFIEIRAGPGRVGAVVSARGRAGVVDAADTQIGRRAALQRHDAARLPAADYRVRHPVRDVQRPAAADRQIVKYGGDHPMAGVERRESALAGEAIAVLRVEGVKALVADSTGVVDGFRPS